MERPSKESDDSHSVKSVKLWQCFGSTYPKTEIVFFGQIILLYVVVVAAIVNLSYPPLAKAGVHCGFLSSPPELGTSCLIPRSRLLEA